MCVRMRGREETGVAQGSLLSCTKLLVPSCSQNSSLPLSPSSRDTEVGRWAIRWAEAGGVLCRCPQAMPAQRKGPPLPCTPQRGGQDTCPQAPASPQRRPAPPQMEPGRSQGRPHVQLVYVNSFGSHRCGSVIRYGGACRPAEAGRAEGWAAPPLSQPSPTGEAGELRAAPAPGHRAGPGGPAAGGGVRAAGSCGVAKPVSRRGGRCR